MYYWNNIIGNELLKTTLKRSAKTKSLSHAYLIDGPYGTGKKLIAKTFSKAIFCETGEAGCTCHSCVQFDSDSHSDLVYIRLEKAKSIGVDDLREKALNNLNKKPFEYNYKIYIIEDAETMTVQAQNALLHSLEEPPSYVVFILLSNNIYKFIPTVLSRCFICKMKPLTTDDICGYFKTDDIRGKIAATCSGGSLGLAIKLYENDEFFEMRNMVNSILANINNCNDLEKIFAELRKLESLKDNSEEFITIALMWLRDVLAYKASKDKTFIVSYDITDQIVKCAESADFKSLYKKAMNIDDFKRSVGANTPLNAALDALAIKFSKSGNTYSLFNK